MEIKDIQVYKSKRKALKYVEQARTNPRWITGEDAKQETGKQA